MGFPPGLFGNYPDRLLQLCLNFPDLRREFEIIELRDEHPEDPIPTSAILVPPPTVSPGEKRQLRASFTTQKLVPEGDETPQPTPAERNLSSFGVTLSNWASWVLLRPLEIPVDMLCGQSQGDLAALCVAGATEYHRLADSFWESLEVPPSYAAPGHLALAGASAERLAPLLAEIPDVAIAIHASRNHMVLGGSTAGLKAASARLKAEGVDDSELPLSSDSYAAPQLHAARHAAAAPTRSNWSAPRSRPIAPPRPNSSPAIPKRSAAALMDNLDCPDLVVADLSENV